MPITASETDAELADMAIRAPSICDPLHVQPYTQRTRTHTHTDTHTQTPSALSLRGDTSSESKWAPVTA